MRLLLSLTLTYFFFLFPCKSDATLACEKARAATVTHSLSETGDGDCSKYGPHAAIIFHYFNTRKSSNQHRYVPGIQMGSSGQIFAPVEILFDTGSVEKTCFHCTPIALKLIFPKHYFW